MGSYSSASLTGSIAENLSFQISFSESAEWETDADGDWQQTVGQREQGSQVSFGFSQTLNGDLGEDSQHADGLTGQLQLRTSISGGHTLSQTDTLDTYPEPHWGSGGVSYDWVNYSQGVRIELAGTQSTQMQNETVPLAIHWESTTATTGSGFNFLTLSATTPVDSATADDPFTNDSAALDDADWTHVIGIFQSRSNTRSENSLSGQSAGQQYNQVSRTSQRTNSWEQLLAPTSGDATAQWGSGGSSEHDFHFSLNQSSTQTQTLAIPLPYHGTQANGSAQQTSFSDISVSSQEGDVFGDGKSAPGFDPDIIDEAFRQYAQAGTDPDSLFADLNPPAGGPEGGDPPTGGDGEGDADQPEGFESGRYGRLTISHHGGFSSTYGVTAQLQTSGSPGNAGTGTYQANSESEASYRFQWESGKSPTTGQWTTRAENRSQEQSQSNSTSWDAAGSWAINGGGFNLSGSYTDQSSQQQSSSSSSSQTAIPTPASATSNHATPIPASPMSSGNRWAMARTATTNMASRLPVAPPRSPRTAISR